MPPPDTGPTRSDYKHLSDNVEKLTRTLEGLQVQMAATYVRQDIYERDQEKHDLVHQGHAEDIAGLKANNQWFWRTLVSAVLPVVVSAVMAAVILTSGSR